ncbi:helix-turn-helix transcriptional regulator [Streptomyces roseus]|uniref:helix-turn-helix domain-containing protein n=1 Tax=Streptomyces roseus TaxID=66430 RepID=UPI0033E364B6
MHQPPTTFPVDGAAIGIRRMQAGMSVRQLASQVGCTPNYLRKIERGARQHMGPAYYIRLRTALQAADSDLLAK